jgi:hypothetical protein
MMKWVGHVAHMGEMSKAYNISVGNLKGRDCSGEIGEDGGAILI